jgi:Cu-Zn family superoxide dismutase
VAIFDLAGDLWSAGLPDLFDLDGSAVIVHADSDNYANIPDRYRSSNGQPGPDAETLEAGDSGSRVACGVVR